LRATQQELSLQGLVLAGMVIGALGVLDDLTVSQSSTAMACAAPTRASASAPRGVHKLDPPCKDAHSAATADVTACGTDHAGTPQREPTRPNATDQLHRRALLGGLISEYEAA
jgi:hypothetical protein